MGLADAEIYHKRAWACLREASDDPDEGRRAILATAAITWETLAKNLEDRANHVIDHSVSHDEKDEDWLKVEVANAWATSLARRY